jgi:four helix bundle protein
MKQTYTDLIVWQKAIRMVTDVYRLTATFPADERFGLISQIRRSAVSVPSNIAEGQGRLTRGEFRQFLGVAKGSLHELDTQIIIAGELGFVDSDNGIFQQTAEVARLLNGLLRSLAVEGSQTPSTDN